MINLTDKVRAFLCVAEKIEEPSDGMCAYGCCFN